MVWEEYLRSAPNIKEIHYWQLRSGICVGFDRTPEKIKLRGRTISIKKLSDIGKDPKVEEAIRFVALWRNRVKMCKLKIKLPIILANPDYVRVYSLMLSEGSFKSEFRLHVPEEIFHEILTKSLVNLFGKQILNYRHAAKSRGIDRTRFASVIRYMLPIPEHIPKFILEDKEFSRMYLRIAFEAEGSPVLVKSKRYIRLVRSTNVSDILNNFEMQVGEKIPFGLFREKHPELAGRILEKPPQILLGEHLILLHHFGIFNKITPELIRRNKTSFRRGEFSAKWALHIYAEDVETFAREIGFLTERKKLRIEKMMDIHGRRRRWSCFNLMCALQKDGVLYSKDFVAEMKKRGYVTPRSYLSRYKKKELIEQVKYGVYKIRQHP